VLANGAEAGRDPFAITAILEHAAPKLLAPAADYVFRGGTGGANGAFEDVRHRYGCGNVAEGFNAHHASRVGGAVSPGLGSGSSFQIRPTA